MTIVVSQRCTSNLKFICNYKKLSKHEINGFFLQLFFIHSTLKNIKGLDEPKEDTSITNQSVSIVDELQKLHNLKKNDY